jgi:hypothetical protein
MTLPPWVEEYRFRQGAAKLFLLREQKGDGAEGEESRPPIGRLFFGAPFIEASSTMFLSSL